MHEGFPIIYVLKSCLKSVCLNNCLDHLILKGLPETVNLGPELPWMILSV